MIKRVLVLSVVALSSAAAQTQAGAARMPADLCRDVGNAYQTKAVKAARDSGKSPDATPIVAESKRLIRGCADTLSRTNGTIADLSALSSLWLYLGDTVRAEKIVTDLAARKGLSEADRADIAMAGLTLALATWDPFAGANPRGEAYAKQIDAMSDAVIDRKVNAHYRLMGRYDYADLDDPIRDQAVKTLAVVRRAIQLNALPMTDPRPAQGNAPAMPAHNRGWAIMLSAYGALARTYGDFMQADSALAILDQAEREVGSNYPLTAKYFESNRAMYKLVGTRATPVDGKCW
jgi:hypothetical protein